MYAKKFKLLWNKILQENSKKFKNQPKTLSQEYPFYSLEMNIFIEI